MAMRAYTQLHTLILHTLILYTHSFYTHILYAPPIAGWRMPRRVRH
jgi:hypothetical protein